MAMEKYNKNKGKSYIITITMLIYSSRKSVEKMGVLLGGRKWFNFNL